MSPRILLKPDEVKSRVVPLTGGINESVTTMELNPGELMTCVNYFEVSGPYSGYSSCPGYEIFDGSTLPSQIETIKIVDPETGDITIDDTDREIRRGEIDPVPGEGQARGVWLYGFDVYAVRDTAGGTAAKLWRSTNTGWSEVIGADLAAGGHCRWVNARFSKYPEASSMVNDLLMFMVDGKSKPISWDGTTIRQINHASLPSHESFTPAPIYPTFIGAFENRLFLVYRKDIFFSAVGDASNFDAVDGAGQIPLGDEVTNVILAPGNALVFVMRNSIKILYNVEGTSTADFSFQLKEYSNSTGGIADTAVRIFNDVYIADDRGPTTLRAVDAFGDFTAVAMTMKTQFTYRRNIPFVTAACANKKNNQYRIFYSNNAAIFYTMQGNKMKGAGYMVWPVSVKRVVNGEDRLGSDVTYFTTTDEDGFVYKMDSGTSFNGTPIVAYFTTAFYHHSTPRNWKHLLAISFELTSQSGIEFFVRPEFDYKDPLLPTHPYTMTPLTSEGGVWGVGVWGTFIWGGSSIQRPMIYSYGYGTSIAISVRTESKHNMPHVLHSYITDYSIHERRL